LAKGTVNTQQKLVYNANQYLAIGWLSELRLAGMVSVESFAVDLRLNFHSQGLLHFGW